MIVENITSGGKIGVVKIGFISNPVENTFYALLAGIPQEFMEAHNRHKQQDNSAGQYVAIPPKSTPRPENFPITQRPKNINNGPPIIPARIRVTASFTSPGETGLFANRVFRNCSTMDGSGGPLQTGAA
jgi:hypothetical protein